MATLPAQATGLPTIEPGNAPDVYQRVQASPEAFGATTGRALQGFGQDLQQTSTNLFHTADVFDHAAADEAANQFQARVQSLVDGDPNAKDEQGNPVPGYLGLNGRAALDARPQVVQNIDGLQREIGGKLKNPNQQKLFSDFATRYKLAQSARISGHADSQAKVWYGEVNASSEKLALSQIAANPNDPKMVASGAADLINARVKNAELHGAQKGDPVWREAMVSGQRDALKTQLEAMAVEQPAKALDILEKNKQVAGVYYDDLATKFRTRAAQQRGITAAEMAMTGAASVPHEPVPVNASGAEAIHAAIIGQESGGNPNVAPSVNGAVGPGQIMPETFKRFAHPGEDINNPLDNAAVSRRITDSYMQKYNGDAARVAVAYFSGEGNVAPAGNPTPYIRDVADGNGKTVSSYVADVQQRMGAGTGAPPIEATIARNRAASVRAILEDKSLDEPARTAALTRIKQVYDAQTVAAEQDAKAKKAANDAAADGYTKTLLKPGGITPAVLEQIRTDPSLTFETRRTLYDAAVKASGETDTRAYGEGFWKAFKAITAPPGTEGRITDASQLYSRAGPGGDLTLAGVEKLRSTMTELQRPESAAAAEMKKGALDYAKRQLSFEFEMGNFKLADPKGMDDYQTKFIPAFYAAYDAGIQAGKTPAQLLSKESPDFIVDKLVSTYKRSDAQMARDRIAAGGEAPATPYKTPNDLREAVRSGKLNRDQAIKIGLEQGWMRPAPAEPVPAVPVR